MCACLKSADKNINTNAYLFCYRVRAFSNSSNSLSQTHIQIAHERDRISITILNVHIAHTDDQHHTSDY